LHLTIGLQWGGAETLMAAIARRLDPSRFEVSVVALQGNGPIGEQLSATGFAVTPLYTSGGWDFRAVLRLKRLLAQSRPDIVHAHLLRANLLACLTRDDHTVVWHEHGTGEWLNPAVRLLERRLMIQSDAVIAISNKVKDNLVQRVPGIANRVTILPNAIEINQQVSSSADRGKFIRKAWGLGETHQVIGFVGRLDDAFKGISYLIKSVAILKPIMPLLNLIIVGEGRDRAALERLAKTLGLKESVHFIGAHADLEQIYPGFNVLALPSLSEGFGIVLLQAMAASLPVVASRVGGIPEVVSDQETGFLVKPADPEALARALQSVLIDRNKAVQMGERGLKRVREFFNLDNIIPRLETIYEDVVTRKGEIS